MINERWSLERSSLDGSKLTGTLTFEGIIASVHEKYKLFLKAIQQYFEFHIWEYQCMTKAKRVQHIGPTSSLMFKFGNYLQD
jgi:hypothetical protein